MEKKILDAVKKAIDEALKEFLDRPNLIFDNKKEQLTHKFTIINELKSWKKNQTCIVKNCKNRSIENSHTIQKSGSIKQISENGHVLTPNFNSITGKIELIKVGVNEASTFPGYCSEHEKLFQEFEQSKEFENGEHLGLQLYRTVCREIVIAENHLKQLQFHVEKYKEFRNKKVKELILKKIDPAILSIPTLEFKNFKVTSNDYRLRGAKKQLDELSRYLNNFLYIYQNSILDDLQKKRFKKIAYIAIHFDREIPVALAGRGNFFAKLKTKTKEVEVIFNVLPFDNKTYIFISTLKKYESELKFYMQHFINPLQLVSMIENWMIHGSDHWFLKPSIWENVENKYRTDILEEILDNSYNIGNELRVTIFNDLKLESIRLMKDNYDRLTNILKQLLEQEMKKITSASKNIAASGAGQ
jgi:hypothetical protein